MIARSLRGPLGALLLVLAVLGATWPGLRVQPMRVFDQPFYLGIAQDLRSTGRFTDGYMFAAPGPDGTRPSGMRFAPLYPSLLAAAATLDPALASAMACQVRSEGHDPACPRGAPSIRWLQAAMLVAVFLLAWWMGGAASGSRRVAWLTLLLALPTAPLLLGSVNYLMTETTTLLLVTAATACALAALRRTRRGWLAASGLLLGLAVLTRPAFLYLAYAAVLLGLGLAAWRRSARTALAALLFAGCVALPVAPWVARNAVVLGRPALTHGYDSHTLVQRISFDSMTWREYGLAYLCWLPDGTGLGTLLVAPHACDRFGWDERPDTFYSIGMGPLMQQTLREAGGWDHHLGFLLTHYILREPLWHAAVTLPLALRGAWVAHYWGLVLGPCCLWLTLAALRRLWRERRAAELSAGAGRAAALLVLALPAWFMLAFNAAVAVNQVRYNLMLIPAYALSGGLLAERLLRRLLPRLSGPSPARGAADDATAAWHHVAAARSPRGPAVPDSGSPGPAWPDAGSSGPAPPRRPRGSGGARARAGRRP